MKIEKGTKIENGIIIGYVRTNMVSSRCEFEICPVEDWKRMTEKEAEEVALESLWESGAVEWGY